MSTRVRSFAAAAVATAAVVASSLSVMAMATAPASFYDIETKALDGKPGNLAQYKGKVAVVVNVASKCGYTPQYAGLEKLYRELTPKGVVVLGFPSNDFGGQEPGTAEEIAEFCSATYGVSFPLTEKVEVNGEGRHPLYAELVDVADAEGYQGDIRWNFEKFLIGPSGDVVARFNPTVEPESDEIVQTIEKALK